MKRQDLIKLAEGQLQGARDSRRKWLYAVLEGDEGRAKLWHGCAHHYILAARYMLRDAHTENYDRLHLRKTNAANKRHPVSQAKR